MHAEPLEIVGQRARHAGGHEVNGCRGNHRIGVVNQLRQRVIEVARPRPEHEIGVADPGRQRRLVDERHDPFAHVAPQQVVEVLEGAGAVLGVAALDRVSSRGHVTDVVQQTRQPVDTVEHALETLFERSLQQGVVGVGRVLQQVVPERQDVAVACRFPHEERLDDGAWHDQGGVLAADRFEGGDDLVPQEAVGGVERAHERVHGRLGRQEGQGGRNVPLHPDVLVRILEHETQRGDDFVAVSDERLAGRMLQGAVTESRDQPRQKQAVRGAELTRASDGFEDDIDLVVIQQGHQQGSETGGLCLGEGPRRLYPSANGRVSRVVDQPAEGRFGEARVGLIV